MIDILFFYIVTVYYIVFQLTWLTWLLSHTVYKIMKNSLHKRFSKSKKLISSISKYKNILIKKRRKWQTHFNVEKEI